MVRVVKGDVKKTNENGKKMVNTRRDTKTNILNAREIGVVGTCGEEVLVAALDVADAAVGEERAHGGEAGGVAVEGDDAAAVREERGEERRLVAGRGAAVDAERAGRGREHDRRHAARLALHDDAPRAHGRRAVEPARGDARAHAHAQHALW